MSYYFDWKFYINKYEDLRKAGINTMEKAWDHYEKYGRGEGRTSEEFDWKFYINKYEDLRNNGIDTMEKAWDHYEKYGRVEGRICNLRLPTIEDSGNTLVLSTKDIRNSEDLDNTIGFIILRHVNNSNTNQYWIHCYNCIRKFYPENSILIIDDNSNYTYITNYNLYKTTIINSEYKGRGELLPYYYYLNNKLFDTAVILHDSVFINKYINFKVNYYKIIWDFNIHTWDQIEDETEMIKLFNNKELLDFYNDKNKWEGCFGGMSIITHEYLKLVNNKYNISLLLNKVLTRFNRCSFERVIGVLLQKDLKQSTLLGHIHKYCSWGANFENKHTLNHLPIIKIWTGR